MKKKTKYLNASEGQQMIWNCNLPVKLVCCGCGLTHVWHFKPPMKKGFVRVTGYVDRRATAAFRRGERFK